VQLTSLRSRVRRRDFQIQVVVPAKVIGRCRSATNAHVGRHRLFSWRNIHNSAQRRGLKVPLGALRLPPAVGSASRASFSPRDVYGGAALPAVTPARRVGGFCVQRGVASKGVGLSLLAHRLARPAAPCVSKGLVRSSVLSAGLRVRPRVFQPCPCASGDGLAQQIMRPCPRGWSACRGA